jgi:streptomycin 6-kinase
MKFCESESGVDYAAMATSQLKLRAHDVIQKLADYEQRLAPVTALMETLFAPDDKPEAVSQLVPDATWYRSLCYKTQESWSHARRVVTKVCYGSKG